VSTILNSLNEWSSRRLSSAQKRRLRGLRTVLSRFSGQSLANLAALYHTDKCDWHWYIDHYERHFGPFRRRRVNLLEIGIGGYEDPRAGGASLRMWKAWFRHAAIHGIDIFDKRPHDEPRIRTHQGSQSDLAFLNSVMDEIGEVHLIVDDGSHQNEHVVTTFDALFPRLAMGGIYVVEDTHTSYWPDYGGSADNLLAPHTMMNRLKYLADSINYREFRGKEHKPDPFEAHVVGVHFYHGIVFVEKGVNDGKRPVAG
jgi:hypothetical protein